MSRLPVSVLGLALAAASMTLAAPVALAQAQGAGLHLDERTGFGPRWQARAALNSSSPLGDGAAWQTQAGVLMGDFYFSRPRLGQASGGFRATSGVLLGQRSLALSTPAVANGSQSLALTLVRQARPQGGLSEPGADSWSALPYVGVGWSGGSLRGGWGVSADVGLIGRTAGGLRLNGNSAVEEVLREWRLAPVVQLGVSYAF